MQAIILKLISMLLSVLMFFSNAFSLIFPYPPVKNTYEVCSAENFDVDKNNKPIVIDNYMDWLETAGDSTQKDKYNWKSFFKKSVVLVPVTLPNPGYSIEVKSIIENNNELLFEYYLVPSNDIQPQVIKPMVVLIETSKKITTVSTSHSVKIPSSDDNNSTNDDTENDKTTAIPVMQEYNGYNYFVTESDNFHAYNKVISTYADLQKCLDGDAPEFDKYDETYFETGSLASAVLYYPADGKTICLTNVEEKDVNIYNSDKELLRTETYLFVDGWVENGDTDYSEGIVYVVIETGKNIDNVSFTRLGFGSEGTVFHYEEFGNLPLTDNETMIVSDYKTWSSIVASEFYEEYFEESGVCEAFFEDKNLALGLVMIPNNSYIVDITGVKENSSTATVNYDVIDKYDNHSTLVEYKVVATEVSKDVTTVNLNCNTNRMQHTTFSANSFNLTDKNPVLVSDYTTWTSVLSDTSSKFSEYDKDYFDNNAIVLIPARFPDTATEAELINVSTENDVLKIVYGLNNKYGIGMTVLTNNVILVEIPNNTAASVVAEEKNLRNFCTTSSDSSLMTKEPTIISKYEVWVSMVDTTDEKYARYDETYFKNNSLVVFTSVLPDSGAETVFKYAYEENDVLNIGYTSFSMGGLTVLCYEAAVIEVSKDVTQVNAVEF